MKDLLQGTIFVGAFLVLFIPLIVSDSMFFPYITGKNFAFRILVEVIFTAWVLLALLDVRYRPRFSWIMISGLAFLIVMFLANFFGEYSPKSFTSNFERMEGYVTLFHFYLYILVLGHTLRSEKAWNWFWNTAIVAGVLVSFYALKQAAGIDQIAQGPNWRLDARLGNSTYLGIYMLFQVFIACWLYIRAKSNGLRFLYVGLGILFIYILFHTGTRGTVLGLFGGGILAFSYLTLMAPKKSTIKKWAAGGALVVTLSALGIWMARDTQFIQSVPMLNRVADITLAEGNIRFMVWQVALEGFKERPLLGWGQENFNYVFNNYYKPALYGAEPWYDRTHNILLDWLIAGGIFGLLGYLSVLISALFYAVLRPFWSSLRQGITDENHFTVYEQSLILGLLSAYTFHNLFVFDNLISYIFYAAVLALIHSRISTDIPSIMAIRIDEKLITNIVAPVLATILALVIYFAHMPGILAAQDMIDALSTRNIEQRFDELGQALNRDSFARQEIVEQMVQQAIAVAVNPDISLEIKEKYLQRADVEMKKLIADKPGDTRLHAFLSSMYRSIGQIEMAKRELDIAQQLSPNKQSLIIEQGTLAAIEGDYQLMSDYYHKAFLLDPSNAQARYLYAGSFLYTGEINKIDELITDEHFSGFAMNDKILMAAQQNEATEMLVKILKERIRLEPDNAQHRASLASVYYEDGQIDKAVAVLEEASREIPAFASLGQCYIDSMQSGEDPRVACQP